MNKIRYLSVGTILVLFIQTAIAQNDYIATDSTLDSSFKLIPGTARDNTQFIKAKRQDKESKYYPNQISEYGLKDGTKYFSKEINIDDQERRVFLERLEYGDINLYYYTAKGITTYFLERDSAIFEISKDSDFRNRLSEMTGDMNWKADQTRLVRYNRNSLSRFIEMYNNDHNQPLPFPRFGIIAGYTSSFLTIPSSMSSTQLDDISFSPSSNLTFGAFADLPIKMSNYSFHTGVNFSKSGFSANSRSPGSDVDVIVNITSINIPLLVRYTIPTLVWRPYINAGGIYSYHFRNENSIYESTIEQNVVTINEVNQEPVISENMPGYTIGAGLQRNVDYRRIVAVEFRYNELFGQKNTLNQKQASILISISF